MEAIQESITKLQQMFNQRMDIYQGELQSATSTANVTNRSAEFTTFRSFIMEAVQSLQNQVNILARQIDAMEMRSRRKILLLHGLTEEKNEDITAAVVKALVGKLKLSELSNTAIDHCRRLGRQSTSDRPRAIIVKLREYNVRNKIWAAKSCLKGSGLTLSEFLTKPRHETFMAAREKFGINRCWTRDGTIFVLGAGDVRHRINSLAELEKIAVSVAPKQTTIAAKETVVATKGRRAGAAGKK